MANRPLMLTDYIGQDKIKMQLAITMRANSRKIIPYELEDGSVIENKAQLPHILLFGNAGLGKTTLAQIIANEYGVNFIEVMASSINTAEDLEGVLAQLSDDQPDIVFIDEIHRLPIKIEELLYTAMEDFVFEREYKDGNQKKIQKCWIPKFTLIGATTLVGDISRPLRDRFSMHFEMQNYENTQIVDILHKLATREGIKVDGEGLLEIAKRSKGVARISINFFHRCYEYSLYKETMVINKNVAQAQFDIMGIDEIGLNEKDYAVLEYLSTQTNPVGIGTIATAIDVDENTFKNVIEPYLVQKGLINRSRRGREITANGLAWITRNSEPTQLESNIQPENSVQQGRVRVGR